MNTKRILAALLLAIMICLAFTGCGTALPETGESVGEVVDNMVPADSSRTGYMTSVEDFDRIVGELVDTSLYDRLDAHEMDRYKLYSYVMQYENKKEYPLDYKVKLTDGTEFEMPVSVPDLEKKGWALASYTDAERELGAGYMTTAICENTIGKNIRVSLCNLTEKSLQLKESYVSAVELNLFSSIDDRTTPVKSCPGFTICGSLTHRSSLEEIISVLGAPTDFNYTIWVDEAGAYSYSRLRIRYSQPKNAYDYLEFDISGDGNYIMTMKYEHIP